LKPGASRRKLRRTFSRPEDVEKVNWQKADAEDDDDGDEHLGDFASRQHLTTRVFDSLDAARRVVGRRAVQTTRRRRNLI